MNVSTFLMRLGLKPDDVVIRDRVTVFDGCGVAIEGHNGFFEYGAERIVVRLRSRKFLIIIGNNLKVTETNPTEIIICGEVLEVIRNEKPDYR